MSEEILAEMLLESERKMLEKNGEVVALSLRLQDLENKIAGLGSVSQQAAPVAPVFKSGSGNKVFKVTVMERDDQERIKSIQIE
jgi:hypothetical protein